MTITTVITDWKEIWQEFYNESLEKTWSSELSPKEVKVRLKMLDYTNENIDVILAKLDELRATLSHLAEVAHLLHQSLTNDEYDFVYQSLHFQITINEHIQIHMEPQSETEAEMTIECKVEFENDCLLFLIDEHDPEKLKIDIE